MRADRLGRGFTPAIDALAAIGRRFDNARASVPLTLPSHVTIMTGQLPPQHGVRLNGQTYRAGADAESTSSARAEPPTLASALRSARYRTAAFVGAYVLNRRFGLDDGFETYDDNIPSDPEKGPRLEAERLGSQVVDAALVWLANTSSPFFLWVHLYDPHVPYDPPAEFRAKAGGNSYDGEVAYADAQVARVLGALRDRGLTDTTLVIVTGDHGEGLGEHGEQTHGMLAYDTTLKVPLIIAGPGVKAERIPAPVSLADIAATVQRRAGQPVPAGASAVDLLGALDNDRDVYAETEYPRNAGWHPIGALVGDRWKLLQSSETELYDLESDPGEAENAAPGRQPIVDGMSAALRGLQQQSSSASSSVPADAAERLRALGYVGSSTHTPIDPKSPNPSRVIQRWTQFERALALVNAERSAQALPALKALAADFPRAVLFQSTYARALKDSGRVRDALAIYRAAVAANPGDPALFHDLAVAARAAGDLKEATRAEQAALALDPNDPAAHNGLGLAHADAGRAADAAAAFERAVAADPGNPSYWTNLGNAKRELNDLAGAETAYRRALSLDAAYPNAANGLGVLLVQRNTPRDAIEWFETALQRAPDFHEARLNLGIAYQESGDRARAAATYRELLARAPHSAKREREAAAALLKQVS
jgi:arylsulfatase A-like enzyme/Flp pilus assembly protein TadD